MTADLQIRRFAARHRVADDAGRERARRAQARLLDGELEAALGRLVAPGEIVLIERIRAQVRLDAQGGEADDARAWADALTWSVEQALRHAGHPGVLRFATRPLALRAFVGDALNGQAQRDWAWQRLGWLPAARDGRSTEAQRRDALLRCLADGDDGVPLLRQLLPTADWPRLIFALDDRELRGLALSVLARLAGPAATFDASPQPPAPDRAPGPDDRPAPAWFESTTAAAGTPARRTWAWRLATLLERPALARRGTAAIDACWSTWAVAAGAAPGALTTPARPEPRNSTQAPADAQAIPIRTGREHHAPADDDLRASSAGARPAQPGTAGDAALPQPVRDDRGASGVAAPQAPPARVAPLSRTAFGGLLFLVPLLPVCGALARLDDGTLWPGLPQALHELALQLAPMRADDPAALAFCGLCPDARPPEALPPSAAREAALNDAREWLVEHLVARLPERRGPGLLSQVLARDAVVRADPGWIDIVFPLSSVDVALRRAALDLDPGFVPWLGVVLRFRYE